MGSIAPVMETIIISLAVALLLLVIIIKQSFTPVDQRWTLSGERWSLPAGPRGQPVVGNLRQVFKVRDTGTFTSYVGCKSQASSLLLTMQKLSSLRAHGEMATLHMGSRTWVLLNTSRVVTDIINKRSKITNERPYMPIPGGLVSQNKRAVIREVTEWVEGRRVMHSLLSGSALKAYGEYQKLESLQLILSYLSEPRQWYAHHFRYSTANFHRIVMGERLSKSKAELDDYQQVTMDFIWCLNRSPIDFFPKLDKLPKFLQLWRKLLIEQNMLTNQPMII